MSDENMGIRKKRIRTLGRYLPGFKVGKRFRIGVKVDEDIASLLDQVGFRSELSPGDGLIPGAIGPVTEFNANGREITRRNLPKEPRSYMVYTTWNDWHGNSHSGVQHRTVDAYPIEHEAGPEEVISIVEKDGDLFAVSSELEFLEAETSRNLHVINVFLEIFGHCSVLEADISLIALPELRRLEWRILPPGEYPWSKARDKVREVTDRLPEEKQGLIEYRLQKITEYRPDFMAIGQGGFSGYFVLGFSEKNLAVLESIHLGNATYVFSDNWGDLSKLSKKEILDGDLHLHRFIHNSSWEWSVRKLLGGGPEPSLFAGR